MVRLTSQILVLLAITTQGLAQDQHYPDSLVKKRLQSLAIGTGVIYTGSMVALHQLWYADFEQQSFHFFNDNSEWLQMDKAGHFFAGFHISKSGYHLLRWSGLKPNKAMLWGTLMSAIALTPIEVFDGFSSGYGASVGDLGANTMGALLFYIQQAKWSEIRIHPKYYFRRSNYAKLRPELLGSDLREELIKDYNAQEYWLSFDLSKFDKRLPKWLNLSLGYGASGMISANRQQNEQQGLAPSRHYYLGIDFDLNEYHTGSKLVNTIFYVVNMIRIPAPALELNRGKFKWHFIY